MTIASLASPATAAADELSPRARAILSIFVGFLVSLALCWPRARDIWLTGNFYDSDDAMRMVQARDFAAGQGWNDLTAWRLDPPRGSLMHWSRVVDVPIVAMLRFFQLFASAETAERLMRIAFPLSLQIGLLAAIGWAARVLLGPRGIAPAVALTVLSGFMLGQFVPGRVDHHAPQIILLALMLASMAAALDPARARLAALSAACASLSLAISIENLLFLFAVFATPPIMWISSGRAARPLLLWFGAGLTVTIPFCLGLFNAPSRWLVPACDAFSYVYAAIALGAAGVCFALAGATRWDGKPGARAAIALAAGAIIGTPLLLAFSNCLIDPFEGLDPLVRDIWLNNVGEARQALRHFAMYPKSIQIIVIPALIGLTGLGVAAVREAGVARARFCFALSLGLLGCLGTAFMIRVATSLGPVALLGCAWIAVQIAEIGDRRGWSRTLGALTALCATLPMSSIGWSMAPAIVADPAVIDDQSNACLTAMAIRPLAGLPPGLVLASIEPGAYLLAQTPHSVITASYHRNNHGNRSAIDAFMAKPAAARDLVRSSGARYVFACPGNKQLGIIAKRSPEGLAAALISGGAPSWLSQLKVEGTPYRVFLVQ